LEAGLAITLVACGGSAVDDGANEGDPAVAGDVVVPFDGGDGADTQPPVNSEGVAPYPFDDPPLGGEIPYPYDGGDDDAEVDGDDPPLGGEPLPPFDAGDEDAADDDPDDDPPMGGIAPDPYGLPS